MDDWCRFVRIHEDVPLTIPQLSRKEFWTFKQSEGPWSQQSHPVSNEGKSIHEKKGPRVISFLLVCRKESTTEPPVTLTHTNDGVYVYMLDSIQHTLLTHPTEVKIHLISSSSKSLPTWRNCQQLYKY